MNHIRKRWVIVFLILFIIDCYLYTSSNDYNVPSTSTYNNIHYIRSNISVDDFSFESTAIYSNISKKVTVVTKEPVVIFYKYPLINSTDVTMDYNNGFNSSYYWFMSMKPLFKRIGIEPTRYPKLTPVCQLNDSSLGPIKVNKTELDRHWVEQQHPDVKTGGYHAPAHCRAAHRVAIIVPYRDRAKNLIIFLHYIHPILKKQLLEYRIFVIEQFGSEKFNKGTLYNIAFLETQRFGIWHCFVFHDVDLIPEDERIMYSCPENPTHMSPAVETYKYRLPYENIFGGVTALTPAQYEIVNGYSNCYWNWGGEDDDMRLRLISKNYTLVRYNSSIARFATLPHPWNGYGNERKLFLMLSKLRFLKEGLTTTKYKLVSVTEENLYTHILAEVNPTKQKLDTKSLMQHVVQFHGKSIEYDRQELQLRGVSARSLRRWYMQQQRTVQSVRTTT